MMIKNDNLDQLLKKAYKDVKPKPFYTTRTMAYIQNKLPQYHIITIFTSHFKYYSLTLGMSILLCLSVIYYAMPMTQNEMPSQNNTNEIEWWDTWLQNESSNTNEYYLLDNIFMDYVENE